MKKVEVDFKVIKGKVKPLHGVNNGPLTRSFTKNASQWFKDASIPYSRLHDTEGTYGAGHFVDVPAIFKNFDADPDDPASYHFEHTDVYLKAIQKCGTKIIYRLGVSIENWAEHGGVAMHILPPTDYIKWAKICAGIIRHYNDGWANGYHMDIQYWEIWNEPESKAMWNGTLEEFNEFYVTAASYLKQEFPKLKFGGYASIGFYPVTRAEQPYYCEEPLISLIDKLRAFLSLVKERNAPLDFFSWHLYSNDPEEYRIHAKAAEEILKEYGFNKTESILDEWNREVIAYSFDSERAALTAAVLCVLQETSVSIATYYDAQFGVGHNGLFGRNEVNKMIRLKSFYAMKAFGHLYCLGNSASIICDQGVYGCAAINDNEAAVLLVNCCGSEECIKTNISGLFDTNVSVTTYSLDEENNLEAVKFEKISSEKLVLYNTLKENTVVLIKIKKRP